MDCIAELSKDLEGQMDVRKQTVWNCGQPPCRTLVAHYELVARVTPNPACDKLPGFDGEIRVKLRMTTKDDGEGRGYHSGSFHWQAPGAVMHGRMQGTTNNGTHRPPFTDCEPCDQRGHLEGVMRGEVEDGEHDGCRLEASYMINYDHGKKAQSSAMFGTIEGSLRCACEQPLP